MSSERRSWLERKLDEADPQGREERERQKNSVTVASDRNVTYDGGETIVVWRLRMSKGQRYRIDEHVAATVETGGNLRTHPTVTRTVAGAALTGTPIGAAFWKKSGSLFMLLEGKGWAEVFELSPKEAKKAQLLAQRVNLVAKIARQASSSSETVPPGGSEPVDAIGQLERLAKLRADGVLSDEEFAAEKRRILDR
jgi:hypothetical protein